MTNKLFKIRNLGIIDNHMAQIYLQETIPEDLAEKRLDQVLVKLFPDYSRNQLQRFIREGCVSIDGAAETRPRTKTVAGQRVVVEAELKPTTNWQAQELELNFIYEDEALLIVNKPAGLVVHPGAGNPDNTLVNALLHHRPELEQLPRAGIIHRLDKNTSGLLLVARQPATYQRLIEAMQQRLIQREYIAISKGVMTAGGRIEAPIGRHPQQRVRMAVTTAGKPAVTHYRVQQRYRAHTLVTIKLETGRTHQIRVHMTHIGYPLAGDPVYGKHIPLECSISDKLRQALAQFKRQALHACRLQLVHPLTQEAKQWQAEIPDDMQQLIQALEEDLTEYA